MKLWLDDMRPAPEGWMWARTVEDALNLLKTGEVRAVSLDNDLGAGNEEGYVVADWIERQAVAGKLGPMMTYAHTQNRVARDRMKAAFRNARAAWKAGTT